MSQGGGWQFIGRRPQIKGHPFMEKTKEKILGDTNRIINEALKKGWGRAGAAAQGAPPTP